MAGAPMFMAHLGGPASVFKRTVDAYREAARNSGFDPVELPVATAGFFYAAESSQQALKDMYPHINEGMKKTNGAGFPKQHFAQGVDPHNIMNIGSPQQIIEKILYQHEMFNHQRYIAQIDFGGMPFKNVMKNVEIIGTEILPAIRKYTKNRRHKIMKIVGLSGSKVGSKTRTAMDYTMKAIADNYPDIEITLLDLADYDIQFSDGRNYLEYEGDTGLVTKTLMEADAIIIGTPVFQASIPATLKNIFDLLPQNAFRDKVVSIIVTAGSSKHYLIAEQQLKPILAYMKAQIVQTYVFIEEKDFQRKEIIDDDVLFRIERLVEDTIVLTETYTEIRAKKEAQYDF